MNKPDGVSATEIRDAAYEIKFVIPQAGVEAVLGWARTHLTPDPRADGRNGDGYRVNSLYFDTPQLDVYRRIGSYGKSKYRVRRYGNEENIFLERKLKSRGLVSKRRTRVADPELLRLTRAELDPEWIGYWFGRRVLARRLSPQCQIRYERVARVGMTAEGPIRLTVDRDLSACLTQDYGVAEAAQWIPLLPDNCIVELKFRLGMPPVFKSLLGELPMTPQPVSKYRLSIQAFGLVSPQNTESTPSNDHSSADALLGNDPSIRSETLSARPEA